MKSMFEDPFEGTPQAAKHTQYGGDSVSAFEKAARAEKFELNGLYGLRDIDGAVIYIAEYSFIGRCQDYVLLLKPDGTYLKLSPCCSESGYMDEVERPYIENGLVGFKKDGKILIPAEYDFLKPTFAGNYTVFTVTRNGREYYINEEGREVLTRVRRFEGEGFASPFWLSSSCHDFYTYENYVGHRDDSNPNVVQIYGEWVELDRFCWDDIKAMVIDPEDDLPLRQEDTGLLLDKFSYEYAFYFANASGKKPLDKCLKQFSKMDAFYNSWYFTIKIWQAPGETLPAKEVRDFFREIGKKRALAKPVMAVGHSESLKPGEVKVLLITNYNERCFPPQWEFDWFDKCDKLPITELRKEVPALKETIEKDILPEYREDDFKGMIDGCLRSLKYEEEYLWADTRDALEYFREQGSVVDHLVCVYLYKALDAADRDPEEEMYFYLSAARWVLEYDRHINSTISSKTVLDILNELQQKGLDDEAMELVVTIRDAAVAKGAITYEERLANEDYYKEMRYLRGL